MRYLIIHQNFPGQFRHVAQALASDLIHEVVAVGDAVNLQGRPALHPRIRVLGYKTQGRGHQETHHYLRDFETQIRRGQAVAKLLLELRNKDNFFPDVVLVHPGWGEGLFIKDVYPNARIVQYFEYYYQSQGGDVGFDPEYPSSLDDQLRVRIKNSTQQHGLIDCDMGISPTNWQRSRYPIEVQSKITVIHDGIATNIVKPDNTAWVEVNGHRLRAGDEVVTYVARNLEPYRGFHTFVRSLQKLQSLRPHAKVIIVGGNDVSYGKRLPEGQTYKDRYCAEVHGKVDWSKVFFVGKLSYADYLKVLQVSAAHVYLTYPFVLSWSMLEAMSAGCLLIASNTAPVVEVVQHEHNGLLVDFFDSTQLAEQIANVLAEPEKYQTLRHQARLTITSNYNLETKCLPAMLVELKKQPV